MDSKENNKQVIKVKSKSEKNYDGSLPHGYRFTSFREGDENNWAYIQYKSGSLKDYQQAVRVIFKESKILKNEINKRCLFLENEVGERIGTFIIVPKNGKENSLEEIKYLAVNSKYKDKGLENVLVSKAYQVVNDIGGEIKADLEENKKKVNDGVELGLV